MTKDAEVVLDHDGVVRRLGRKRPISELSRSQLPDHIPALGELFDALGTDFDLSIDIKDDTVTSAIVSVAQECRFPLERLWLCHFRHDEVLAIRRQFSDVRVVDSTRLSRLKQGLEPRASMNSQRGIDAINLHFSDWNGGLVTLTHRFNLLAFGWDVQFEHQLENGLKMGLDALYSDHVDRLVDAYVSHCGIQPPRD